MKPPDDNIAKGHSGMPLLCRYCREVFLSDRKSWTAAKHMHSTALPGRHAGIRGYGLYLSMFLIPGTVLCMPLSFSEPKPANRSRPYLVVAGPPALRFQDALVPQPDVSTRPPAGAPPHPMARPAFSAVRVEPRQEEVPSATAATSQPLPPKPAPAPEQGTTAAPILPDEARSKIRPEDFLPYFQFPGAGSNPEDVSSVPTPPEPGKLPPSTATYRQQ